MTYSDPTSLILLFFIMPIWFVAGLSDWVYHRRTHIETTSGLKESAIHLLMFVQVGLIMLPGIFMEINTLAILIAIVMFVAHEATALWDVSYTSKLRNVNYVE